MNRIAQFLRNSVPSIWLQCCLLTAVLFFAVVAESRGDDKFWDSFFGGAFNAGANWQDGVVPAAGDVAHFGRTTSPLMQADYTVDFDIDPTNQALIIEDDFVTFDLNGHTYTTTLAMGNEIGNVAGQSGRLTIENGLWDFSAVRRVDIGVGGGTGTLIVSTSGLISGTPFFLVGSSGTGTLTVQNGGDVAISAPGVGHVIGSSSTAPGTVNVTGAGSTYTGGSWSVGSFGPGTLNIDLGGVVQTPVGATAIVGDAANGDGTVNVEGATSQWIDSADLTVGLNGSGTLNINMGGDVSNVDGYIGKNADSTGTATVTGGGSTWTNNGELRVGDAGMGTLMIEAGGSVSSTAEIFNAGGTLGAQSDSTGTATVTGAGSTWTTNNSKLVVGDGGMGTLSIEAGGSVSNAGGYIGQLTDSTGDATITGAGSIWTNSGGLVVGSDGAGTLTIEDGGHVSNDFGFVGDFENSVSTATVTGAGSSWTNGLLLAVGQFGRGTMTIEAGGFVSNTNGSIAGQPDSIGEVTVTGGGSMWDSGNQLFVGFDGMGTLTIEAGGSVTNVNGFIAGAYTSTGTANVTGTGSNWTMTGRLGIGEGVDEELGPDGGTGTLNIQPGGTVSVAQDTALFPGGTLNLDGGTLDTATFSFQGGGAFNWTSGTLHVETFNGDLVNQSGSLAPGHSAGSTSIVGSYTQQAGASLEIEIGATEFDLVTVTNSVSLGGTLDLSLIAGFLPDPTDTFDVLNAAGGISGTFSNVSTGQRLDTTDGLGSFLVHYGFGSLFDSSHIVLSDFEMLMGIPGDYNGDTFVNAADYTVWRNHLGQAFQLQNEDPDNMDGMVTAADYEFWKAHYGESLLPAGTGTAASDSRAAVPEPATATLLALAALAVLCEAGGRR